MLAELSAFAELSKRLIALVKEVSAALPDGEQKHNLQEKLKNAERELAIAEASTAKDFGYELCQCTFPPQIMLFTGKDRVYQCHHCGHCIDKSLYAEVAPIQRGDFFNDF